MSDNNVTGGKQRRRALVIGGILVSVLAIGWVGGARLQDLGAEPIGPPVTGVTRISVEDDRFGPNAIEVPAGTEVTWDWIGEDEHNVVGEGFESPVQTSGSFAHTFSAPGIHDYRCTLHGSMRGQVIVPAAQSS